MLFSLSANALDIHVGDDFEQQPIDHDIKYWLTDDPTTDPPHIGSPLWRTSDGTLTFGFDQRTLWFYFSISNTTSEDQTLLLDFEYPLLDEIDLTYTRNNAAVISFELGDTRPITQHIIKHPHILAPITLSAQSSAQVMVRVYTTATLNVPMTLWNDTSFLEQSQIQIAYYVFLYGILIGIALYHLVLFIQLRESGFLWFSLFLLSLVAIFAYFQGFLTTYIWPQYRDYSNQILVWCYALTATFCSAYILRILNVKRFRPGYARSLYLIMILGAVMIVISHFLTYSVMIRILTLYAILSVIIVVSVQIRKGLDKYEPAYYAIGAGFFCAAGMTITILEKTGVVTSTFFTRSAGDIGFTVMAILYALSLSQRMKWEQVQRKMAQNRTVEVQEDLLEVQRKLNKNLESLVSDRTSELEKANDKLRTMSVTDALTGLFNRRYFDEFFYNQYQNSAKQGTSMGLLIIDIDHFKTINDNHGHPFGDQCLIKVAKRLQDIVINGMNVVARYGGEEFIVVLPNADINKTLAVADTILESLRNQTIDQDAISLNITASIGAVSMIPDIATDADQMLKKADDFLYEAKKQGRNRTVSDNTVNASKRIN